MPSSAISVLSVLPSFRLFFLTKTKYLTSIHSKGSLKKRSFQRSLASKLNISKGSFKLLVINLFRISSLKKRKREIYAMLSYSLLFQPLIHGTLTWVYENFPQPSKL